MTMIFVSKAISNKVWCMVKGQDLLLRKKCQWYKVYYVLRPVNYFDNSCLLKYFCFIHVNSRIYDFHLFIFTGIYIFYIRFWGDIKYEYYVIFSN